MIESFSFLRQDMLGWVLLSALVLWLLFIWKENYQVRGSNLIVRTTLSLVAIASLVALVLRPQIETSEVRGVGVILTTNFKKSQLDSLKLSNRDLTKITYQENGFSQAQLDSIRTVYILGNGIAPYDFWQLEGVDANYLGGNDIEGIVQLKYEQQIAIGDSISIIGIYHKPALRSSIILQDPGGNVVDSMQISGTTKKQIFKLRALAKSVGKYVYNIVEKDSLGTVQRTDPLPIVISKKEIRRILILNTFPTFETKYLKNYLAENGHKILIRTQLTKGIYKFENFNRAQSSLYNLTTSNLSEFDLVIIDISSYNQLSASSKKALQKSIESGLGMFIQPEESLIKNFDIYDFRSKRNSLKETALQPFPSKNISRISKSFIKNLFTEAVLQSKDEDLTVYSQHGNGRVGTSVLKDTYQLILNGNGKVYEYLWTTSLNAISKKSNDSSAWNMESFIGYKDEPFQFALRSKINNPIVLDNNKSQIGLKQHISFEDKWEAIDYPTSIGWNHITIQQDSMDGFFYYVSTINKWKSMKSFSKKIENERNFTISKAKIPLKSQMHLIPRWWFLLLFILSMGCLWALPKWNR